MLSSQESTSLSLLGPAIQDTHTMDPVLGFMESWPFSGMFLVQVSALSLALEIQP